MEDHKVVANSILIVKGPILVNKEAKFDYPMFEINFVDDTTNLILFTNSYLESKSTLDKAIELVRKSKIYDSSSPITLWKDGQELKSSEIACQVLKDGDNIRVKGILTFEYVLNCIFNSK